MGNVNEEVGRRVEELMEARRMTRAELGKILADKKNPDGITQTGIGYKLRGKNGFSVEQIVTIAHYFNASVQWIIEGKTEEEDGLTSNEQRLVDLFRGSDEEGKLDIMGNAVDAFRTAKPKEVAIKKKGEVIQIREGNGKNDN